MESLALTGHAKLCRRGGHLQSGCQQVSQKQWHKCIQLSMCLLVYIDFSFGNFDNSTYDRNILELYTTRLIE